MRARPDFTVDEYDGDCPFETALLASNVLKQLRPIINDDHFKRVLEGKYSKWDEGVLHVGVEDAIDRCLRQIRKVRGRYANRHTDCSHLNLTMSFKERTQTRFHEYELQLSERFSFCRVQIDWGERPAIGVENGYSKRVIVDAPYRYSKQIEAELAWVDNKVIGPYSDVEESPDGIHTAYCRYAKMDKHRNWYVHDGFLAWMPHDECIKVKAIGDDREKAEGAARSAARREVLAALG